MPALRRLAVFSFLGGKRPWKVPGREKNKSVPFSVSNLSPFPFPSPLCDDFVVSWGVRGRLGDPLVKERARLVADRILGAGVLDDFWDGLEAPTPLVTGAGWCDNLDPATASPVGQAAANSFRASMRGLQNSRVLEDLKPYRLGPEQQP